MAAGGHRTQNEQKSFKQVIITPVGQLALAMRNTAPKIYVIVMCTDVPANFGNIC